MVDTGILIQFIYQRILCPVWYVICPEGRKDDPQRPPPIPHCCPSLINLLFDLFQGTTVYVVSLSEIGLWTKLFHFN